MCGFFGSFSINGNSPINVDNIDITLYRGPDDHRIFKDKVFYSEFFRLSIFGSGNLTFLITNISCCLMERL